MESKQFDGKHLDKSWLEDAYINQQLSTYEIGKIVNRDSKQVWVKLKDFGIKTRKRGQNLSSLGKDNYMKQEGVVNPFKGKHHKLKTRKILSKTASGPRPWLRGENNGMYGRRGKKSPTWKNGNTPDRQKLYARSEWREIVRQIIAKYNFVCQRCGLRETNRRRMHIHHIYPFNGFPDNRLNFSDITVLCSKCHGFVHSKKNVKGEYLKYENL